MIGAQALIAFKKSDGSLTAKTYNLTSYGGITQSKLLYKVSGLSAEYSGELMTIFATIGLPENTTKLNQVWQVGSSVVDGMPVKHAFAADNLNSKGTLELVPLNNGTTNGGGGGSGSGSSGSTSNNNSSTNENSNYGSRSIGEGKFVLYVSLIFIGIVAF